MFLALRREAMLAVIFTFLVNVAHCAFLSRHSSAWCPNLGEEICRVGRTSVLVSRDGNVRKLRFGDECATETMVRCVGDFAREAGSCDGSCNPCPCEFDASGELSASYMRVMFQQLHPWCSSESEAKVLLIGLGGGELPQYLAKRCGRMQVDAVELSSDVIDVAKTFFGLGATMEHSGRVKVEQADALTAVRKRSLSTPSMYDAVLVDCFSGGGEVPDSCRSGDFAQRVRDILKPSGQLLQNVWSYSPSKPQVSEQYKETVRLYRSIFPGALRELDVPMPPRLRFVSVLKGTRLNTTQLPGPSL